MAASLPPLRTRLTHALLASAGVFALALGLWGIQAYQQSEASLQSASNLSVTPTSGRAPLTVQANYTGTIPRGTPEVKSINFDGFADGHVIGSEYALDTGATFDDGGSGNAHARVNSVGCAARPGGTEATSGQYFLQNQLAPASPVRMQVPASAQYTAIDFDVVSVGSNRVTVEILGTAGAGKTTPTTLHSQTFGPKTPETGDCNVDHVAYSGTTPITQVKVFVAAADLVTNADGFGVDTIQLIKYVNPPRPLWLMGDGSSTPEGTSVTHTYTRPGTYQVGFLFSDSDAVTNVATITVTKAVELSVTPTSGAAPLTVQATHANAADGDTPRTWDFGDGSMAKTDASVSHTYAAPGQYQLTLTTNGETATQEITVNQPPDTQTTFDTTQDVYDFGQTVTFNLTNHGPSELSWGGEEYTILKDGQTIFTSPFNDGVQVISPSQTTSRSWNQRDQSGTQVPAGAYVVQAKYGIRSGTGETQKTAAFTVAQEPPRLGQLSAVPSAGFAPLTVQFTYSGTYQNIVVDLGDGNTVTRAQGPVQFSHTYLTPGTYVATVHAGTAELATTTVQVRSVPRADTTFQTSSAVYELGADVRFTLTNLGPDDITLPTPGPYRILRDGQLIFAPASIEQIVPVNPGQSKSWTWSQVDTNGTQVPAGAYVVALDYTLDGKVVTKSASFTIAEDQPEPGQLLITPTSGQAPLTVDVTYTGELGNITIDMNDGTVIQRAQGPVNFAHTYVTPGTYLATVRAGATQIGQTTVQVTPPPPPPSATTTFVPGESVSDFGETVEVTLTNQGPSAIRLEGHLLFKILQGSTVVYDPPRTEVVLPDVVLGAGQAQTYVWDQKRSSDASQVPPGSYSAQVVYVLNSREVPVSTSFTIAEPADSVALTTSQTSYENGGTVTATLTNQSGSPISFSGSDAFVIRQGGTTYFSQALTGSLTASQSRTLTWDQQNSQGNQVAPGTYEARASYHLASGTPSSKGAIFSIDDVAPALGEVLATPTSGEAPLGVHLVYTGTFQNVVIEMGDGTVYHRAQGPVELDHTYLSAGSFRPLVRAGQQTVSGPQITVAVQPPQAVTSFRTTQDSFTFGDPVTFTLTNLGPDTVTLTNPAPFVIKRDGEDVFRSLEVGGAASTLQPGQRQTWAWDQKDETGAQVASGAYAVEVLYKVGDVFATKSAAFTIAEAPPPPPIDGEFTVVPTSGEAPLTVQVEYTGTHPNIVIDLGDGTVVTRPNGPVSFEHTYLYAGEYEATVHAGTTNLGRQVVSVSEVPVAVVILETDKSVYEPGQAVTISLTNLGPDEVLLPSSAPFDIAKDWEIIFVPNATFEPESLPAGQTKSWTWDQKNDDGAQVSAGAYEAEVFYGIGSLLVGDGIEVFPAFLEFQSVTFTIAQTPPVEPKTGELTVEPTSGTAPLAVKATYTGELGNLALDFGDGSVVTKAAKGPGEFSHTYTKSGTFTVTFRAEDKLLGTKTVTVAAAPVTPPPLLPLPTFVDDKQDESEQNVFVNIFGGGTATQTVDGKGKQINVLAATGSNLVLSLLIALALSGLISYFIIRRPFHGHAETFGRRPPGTS